jgi:hypothetical protein
MHPHEQDPVDQCKKHQYCRLPMFVNKLSVHGDGLSWGTETMQLGGTYPLDHSGKGGTRANPV